MSALSKLRDELLEHVNKCAAQATKALKRGDGPGHEVCDTERRATQACVDLLQAAMDADAAELRERANNKAEACCNYHLLRAAQYLAGTGKEGE